MDNATNHTALFGIELPLNTADPFLSVPERYWQARLMPEERWPHIPTIPHGVQVWADRAKEMAMDFVAYDLRPHQPEAALAAADWAKNNELKLLLNNPYCQINASPTEGFSTWVYPPELIKDVAAKADLLGVVYDELLHHQVHPGLEGHTNIWNAVADVTNIGDSRTAYEAVENGLKKIFDHTAATGIPVYTEEVVPAFYHAVARSGGRPGCKVLKEQWTPLTTSLCMSAAHQYNRPWMATVDLWEGDSGPWYQIVGRQSGHSSQEFASALKLMALLNPELVLLEAADLFWEIDNRQAPLTEFGEVIKRFKKEIHPATPPAFDVRTWQPTVAIVHAEDGCWHKGIEGHHRWGYRFGAKGLPVDEPSRKWLRAWYHLTWGKCNGSFHYHLQEQKGEQRIAEANHITGDEHSMALWPAEKRRDATRKESHLHGLFHPLNNVAVFDGYVKPDQLTTADLIVFCGSYALPQTAAAVQQAAQRGATVLCQEELAPSGFEKYKGQQTGNGLWFTVEQFDAPEAVDVFYQQKGFQNQWVLKSNLGTLRMWATDAWGNEFDWALER